MSAYGLGHVRHDEGRCHANLGIGDRAQAAQQAMDIRGRGRHARPRAFSLGILAVGHAQAGNVEGACASAAGAENAIRPVRGHFDHQEGILALSTFGQHFAAAKQNGKPCPGSCPPDRCRSRRTTVGSIVLS
jgi:hypothetical protein